MTTQDFIASGIDLKMSDADYDRFSNMDRTLIRERWMSEKGREIIQRWKDADFDRAVIENLVGKLSGKTDLRGISLRQINLRGKDFSNCDLFSADLSQADLWNANLTYSYLSEANLRGTELSWIKVQGTLIDHVEIDKNTKLLGIDLNGLNTNFAFHFLTEAREQQRIDDLIRRMPKFATLLKVTCDYGRSLSRWTAWTVGVMVIFGLVFTFVPGLLHGPANNLGHFDGLYFSVVTFTTLGYGDISPVSDAAKILVTSEVLLGYLMGGIFIAILTRRMLG